MNTRKLWIIIAILAVIVICLLIGFIAYLINARTQNTNSLGQTETVLAQTIESFVTDTISSPTSTSGPEPTASPIVTNTQVTSVDQESPEPGIPIIGASVDTNCRLGPSGDYERVGFLLVGQQSRVHGQNNSRSWWYIENMNKPPDFCWTWGQSTYVQGDTSGLPIITPPPPPPPAEIGFSASYVEVHTCSGRPNGIFRIVNTGDVLLESMNIIIHDVSLGESSSPQSSNSPFLPNPTNCPPGGDTMNPDQTAYVAGALVAADPIGHVMRAQILLCSGENLAGDCQQQIVEFGVPLP